MNRGVHSVRVNPVKGNGVETYVKITQYEFADGTKNKYTFSFGTGPQKYCMIVSIDGRDYTSAYIDRVDKLEKCTRGVKLTEVVEGMAAFIRLGLYAIKKMCPWVTRFTLKDDSKIYCDGLRGPSISMAYDYLVRYDQTWYQKKFGAELEGAVAAVAADAADAAEHEEKETEVVRGKVVRKGSLMSQHLHSLEVLDQPCREFELIRDLFPEMETYRVLYEGAASPRDFLKRVRETFGDPAAFCRGVSKWFDRYIGSLRIQLFMDSWSIPVEAVEEPTGFSVGAAVGENVLRGGQSRTRTRTRTRQGTQKGRWHGISHARGGSGVETYSLSL